MRRCAKHPVVDGLRVTIHDSAQAFCLQLEGDLAGDQTSEAEWCWLTAASTIAGRMFVVDLSRIRRVDSNGRELLARMRSAGAELVRPEGDLCCVS